MGLCEICHGEPNSTPGIPFWIASNANWGRTEAAGVEGTSNLIGVCHSFPPKPDSEVPFAGHSVHTNPGRMHVNQPDPWHSGTIAICLVFAEPSGSGIASNKCSVTLDLGSRVVRWQR